MNLENYEKLENGVIRQINVNKINYDFEYCNDYNKYSEKSIQFSYLRLGVLLGALSETPESILDVGYGNGDFLKVASGVIKNCYGTDISDYPIPDKCKKVDLFEKRHYDVVCFFDSLEHFDDIYVINQLDCDYVFISVPWCHNFSPEWFEQWHHKKENEHLWHFNKDALINFFNEIQYKCIYSSNFEDTIRQNPKSKYHPNILTCLFKKINTVNDSIVSYYKNKKILVTGGTGFIGRNIVNELLEHEIEKLYIFDRTIKYNWKNSSKIIYIEGNLLSDINKIEECDFDIVFHEAANVDTTCNDRTNMIDTNFNAFVNLIEICNKKRAKLIYASSAAVYGNESCPNIVGLNENPLNVYGESKLMMDAHVREQSTNLTVPIIGLRYFNVYGPGENHKGKMMSMIGQMLNNIKNNNNVNLFEYGEQKRDFVCVKDVVKCNLLAGMSQTTNIYNCGYGSSVDFNNIFEIIASYFKNNSTINYIPNTYKFFQNETKADIQLTTNNLNYNPKYDIIKGIYHYYGNNN
uniref:NAD-dependent epimerase/dehydratase domain-containing protein n=1 Tax=viral metagenome TaxID=1070528 RepID=A0A6C0B6V6_9ZZZZ